MAKHIKVELDKERWLRLDINALADLEEVLGYGIGEIFSARKVGLTTLRAMLWASLKWRDNTITIREAGNIIQNYLENGGSMEKLTSYLMEALQHSGIMSVDEAEEVDTDEGKETPASTDLMTG